MSELYANNEIVNYYQHKIDGVIITKEGINSFSNKKYSALPKKDYWKIISISTSIVFGVTAITLSIMNYSINTKNDSEDSKSIIESQKLQLEKQIEYSKALEDSIHSTTSYEIDSIYLENDTLMLN